MEVKDKVIETYLPIVEVEEGDVKVERALINGEPCVLIRIAEGRLSDLERRFNKLEKKAAKLNVEAPTWHKARLWECPIYRRNSNGISVFTGRYERKYDIAIQARPVRLPGWDFVATLQFVYTEDNEVETIIRANPAAKVEVPKEYRDGKSTCDHCKTNRRRNETYVLHHENGTIIRVGSTCLNDFIGHHDGINAAQLAAWNTTILSLAEELGDYSSGGGEYGWDIHLFLAWTASVIRNDGWCSKGKAYELGLQSTCGQVLHVLGPCPRHPYAAEEWRKERQRLEPTEKDVEVAEAAIEWARDIDPETDSDYLHNLRVACSCRCITYKLTGIVASAIFAHSRFLERQLEYKRRESTTYGKIYFGQPGDKIGRKLSKADQAKGANYHSPLRGTVNKIRDIESHYGFSRRVEIEVVHQEQSYCFVWWASNGGAGDISAGDHVEIVATIRSHDEYKGWKSTTLTRAKLEKVAEDAPVYDAIIEARRRVTSEIIVPKPRAVAAAGKSDDKLKVFA